MRDFVNPIMIVERCLMTNINKEIIKTIRRTESEQGVRIPLAIESGSRAWGYASLDSDYDCRFIFVRSVDDYLSVYEKKDTISYVPDKVFDINGWDLKKFIAHIVKSNAVAFEWLKSEVIYIKNGSVADNLMNLAKIFFNPVAVCWHYLSLAEKKLGEITELNYVSIKTILYILRPLACIRFIRKNNDIPHMNFVKNLDSIEMAKEVRVLTDELIKLKSSVNESETINLNPVLMNYIECEMLESRNWLSGQRFEKKGDFKKADETFRNILMLVYDND